MTDFILSVKELVEIIDPPEYCYWERSGEKLILIECELTSMVIKIIHLQKQNT